MFILSFNFKIDHKQLVCKKAECVKKLPNLVRNEQTLEVRVWAVRQ